MIIHPPELIDKPEGCYLSARIEIEKARRTLPPELWFRVDPEWKHFLQPRCDAFLAAMLPLAAHLGEDIEVLGPLSPKLLYGAREYLRIVHARLPTQNHRVEIRASQLSHAAHPSTDAHGTACAFSGGVDAFYTLWSHLPEREPIVDYRIRHALMVNGFDLDVDLDEAAHFPALRNIYAPMFEELGLSFIVLATNLREFRRGILPDLIRSYASAITACGLALGALFDRFYISSSYRYDAQGTVDDLRPIIDPLLSTEATDILYAGADATRYERIQAISQWPLTHSRLRICTNPDWQNVDTDHSRVVNCCRCEKCLLSLVALELTGTLPFFSTFPQGLSRPALRQMHFHGGSLPRIRELRALALAKGNRALAADLHYVYWRSRWNDLRELLRWKKLKRRLKRKLKKK